MIENKDIAPKWKLVSVKDEKTSIDKDVIEAITLQDIFKEYNQSVYPWLLVYEYSQGMGLMLKGWRDERGLHFINPKYDPKDYLSDETFKQIQKLTTKNAIQENDDIEARKVYNKAWSEIIEKVDDNKSINADVSNENGDFDNSTLFKKSFYNKVIAGIQQYGIPDNATYEKLCELRSIFM